MLFKYKVIDSTNTTQEGVIDAVNMDVAINALQRRGFVISSVQPAEKQSFLNMNFTFLSRVKNKEIVILSRQMAILFEAQVSALRIFRLLGSEAGNPLLRKSLDEVATDLQGGSTISKALAKHPHIFTPFYINMVRSGEESGKLDEVFMFLADHLERIYEVTSKAKNALIYPAFVVFTFIAVMILMFTVVIPKISVIIEQSGQDLPIYTQVVLGISNFLLQYGYFFLIILIVVALLIWRYSRTENGKDVLSRLKITLPYLGNLYRKLYVSNIAENMQTMLVSGIPMLRTLEITADVVGNDIFKKLILETAEAVKGGASVSESFSHYEEMPTIMVQMIKVGEETGQLGTILKTMARFYSREVVNAVDTLVDLIEPVMIVALGLGVGILLASVLVPIYNISATF